MSELGGLWLSVAASLGLSFVTFWGLGGAVHLWFYGRRRDEAAAWKVQPRRFLPARLVRHAFWLGSLNMAIGATVGGVFAWHVARGGWSTLYFDPLEHGVGWLVASAVVTYFVIDAGLYYSHRALHSRWLFRHVHRWHHRYTAPVVFTTTAVHPVEFLIFQAFVMLPAVLVPVHWAVYVLVVAYTYLIGMIDHAGIVVRWPLPLHGSSAFHDDHHVHFHCNYGHHTQLFDLLHDTARRDDREYGPDRFAPERAATHDSRPAATSARALTPSRGAEHGPV